MKHSKVPRVLPNRDFSRPKDILAPAGPIPIRRSSWVSRVRSEKGLVRRLRGRLTSTL